MTESARTPTLCTERREFIRSTAQLIAHGAILAVAAPMLASCDRADDDARAPRYTTSVDVTRLATDGQTMVTPDTGIDGAPILIVRQSPKRFLALSMQCTHEGCPVDPPVGGVITCPCHGSQFDLSGNPRRGPAQFPLARYDTTYDAKTRRLTVST